jgi:thioredoxin reductase (NADPH)
MTEIIDIAVVGAGPCGLAVGAAARRAGLRAVLFDRGCITSSIVEYPIYMTFFSTPERLEIGGVPFVVGDAKPTRREALIYYRRVARYFELDVRQYEEVVDIAGSDGDFVLRTRPPHGDERQTRARAVVLATGALAQPNLLSVPGEDLPHVFHTFREALPYYDQDVLIVGGGNSAAESALELFRAGARVTVVHFGDEFDRGVKPWIRSDILNRIEAGEITVRWRTRVERIEPGRVCLREDGSAAGHELRSDWVFALTGWLPDHAFFRTLGITLDPETGIPSYEPDTMETNVAGLYIAGVVVAGYDANKVFIENGRHHGEVLVRAYRARAVTEGWHPAC